MARAGEVRARAEMKMMSRKIFGGREIFRIFGFSFSASKALVYFETRFSIWVHE